MGVEVENQDQGEVGKEHRAVPSSESAIIPKLDAAPSIQAERLIGDLEYGCAADFGQYRGAALAIARAYLRTAHAGLIAVCVHCDPSHVPSGPDGWCECQCHRYLSEKRKLNSLASRM